LSFRPSGAGLRPAIACLAAALACAASPQRIVSVSPVETEILYGVGAFDKVVAVTEYCTYPPEARKLPKVGGWATPSVEKVASFHPDLVVFSEPQAPFLQNPLKQLGIRTVLAPSQTIQDAFTAIAAIGRATGHERQAADLAARTKTALDAVRRRAAALPHPTVLIVVDRTPGTLRDMYAALPGSFLAQLAEIAGGKVAAGLDTGNGYGKISAEMVLSANPDVILDLLPASNSGRDPWQDLPELKAVRNHRVNFVQDQFAPHDSQMIARTAVLFARLLHPEVPAAEWEVH
jgi:cobalamin transport system substrate-binding protein